MSSAPTPRQCRAARALLGISQRDLAVSAGIGLRTLEAFETSTTAPRSATARRIRSALERAGAHCLGTDGVLLKQAGQAGACTAGGSVAQGDDMLLQICQTIIARSSPIERERFTRSLTIALDRIVAREGLKHPAEKPEHR